MYRASGLTLISVFLLLWGVVVNASELDKVAVMLDGGDYPQALQSLEGMDDSRHVRQLRAAALIGMKRHDEAEQVYQALIEDSPKDPTPYNNLARLYAEQGKLQQASELLTQAMKIDARYATIYKNLSSVYVEMSRNAYAKALRLGDKKKTLQLLSLDHRDESPHVVQLALATDMAPAVKTDEAMPEKAKPVRAETSAEAPAVAPVVSEKPDEISAIAALERWASDWSAKKVDGYLSAYDAQFQPRQGKNLAQWREERRVRLNKPGRIQVNLSEFEVFPRQDGGLKVNVVQRYSSDNYSDTSRKGFILKSRNGEWKIMDEYTIEVMK